MVKYLCNTTFFTNSYNSIRHFYVKNSKWLTDSDFRLIMHHLGAYIIELCGNGRKKCFI